MNRLLNKIRQLVGRNNQQDIVPGPARIAQGLACDLKPMHRPETELPRAGARLKGRVETVNDHQQVYIALEEDTEELLALSEDVVNEASEGFDPYNTGRFTTTGAWDTKSRR